MLLRKILVIQCNNLSALTVNSIQQNMPDWSYEVVSYDKGFIRTALKNTNEITLCVKSGVILDIKDGDLPDINKLKNYDIALSREGVFTDDPKNKHVYGLIKSSITKKTMDLSIFIINPSRWIKIPATDAGVLGKVKRLRMPRFMNHKTDIIVARAIGGRCALTYGMLAEEASAFNYTPIFDIGKANGNEMLAYALERALPFTEGLPSVEKQKIEALASATEIRFAKLRRGLATSLPLGD